ncbi:hypothetical protein [Dyadobacter sp. MSC1_007]|jgi:hypothetical protein|uniref:hypothetical protein n=1 Tax=Dyadobacter sp. MSC1_007 TaxID=2909264 RepID=UPI00202F3F3C|nr:hypothetical protein [Dyadobacter sp. MSC1_007]
MGHLCKTSQLAVVCCAVMALAFLTILFHETLNTPSFDDYTATVAFIKDFFFQNKTPNEKFAILFSRHNEHRILPSRLIAVGYFALFNRLNFAHLAYIQNLFLIGSIAMVYRLMIRHHYPWQHSVLVCSSFMLSLTFYQVSFYYWGGIQYYAVIFFSLLSLCYLDKASAPSDWRFISSMLFGAMAVCSFGNGIVTPLLGCVLLWAKKQRSMQVVWLGFTFLCALDFFLSMLDKGVTHSAFRVDWMLRLLLTFSGSFLYIRPPGLIASYANIILCSVFGASVIGYWMWLFRSGYARARPLLFCILSFPLLTAIMIALARFENKSAGGIAPRYMFFSAIIPIMVLLTLWDKGLLDKRWFPRISLGCVLIWSLSFWPNYIEFRQMNSDIRARIVQWEKDSSTRLIYYTDPMFSSSVRKWGLEKHLIDRKL